jgi:hypothetical protein
VLTMDLLRYTSWRRSSLTGPEVGSCAACGVLPGAPPAFVRTCRVPRPKESVSARARPAGPASKAAGRGGGA